jgi:hypothetical protein
MTETDRPVILVSPSEIQTMRQCPLKHQLLYGERWNKERSDESHPLALGTIWHSVMEAHRRTLLATDRNLNEAMAAAGRVILLIQDEKVSDLITWMYLGYVEMWGSDPEWEVVDIEMAAEVDLPPPHGWPSPRLDLRLKIRLDLLVKWKGRIWVVDEKSCKDLPKRLDLDFDDQFGLYYWAATRLGYNVFGAIHSASRKVRLKTREAPLPERFLRTPISRGKTELNRIAVEAWQTAYTAYSNLEGVTAMRRMGVDIESPRHPDPRQCGWKCDFTEACISSRKGVDLRDYIHRKGYRIDHSRH